ncbi:hypothetical protein [Nocardioides dongxiaopingii]|uniref:hypothetical protein n=1 Tax=Nocardioides dongxiaopingii TaxID=2576036 RepID=UPI0010C76EB5|nr:hypothetical protein [Nocardioides dongxiaopingii]
MTDRRAHELVGVGLWALAAGAWVAAMWVPWFRHGVAAGTSPLGGAELLRTGVLDLPPVLGLALLPLPLCALVLLGIAPLRGVGAMVARVLLWLVSTAGAVVLVVAVGSVSAWSFGLGAVLVVVACLLGCVALGFATVREPERAPPTG